MNASATSCSVNAPRSSATTEWKRTCSSRSPSSSRSCASSPAANRVVDFVRFFDQIRPQRFVRLRGVPLAARAQIAHQRERISSVGFACIASSGPVYYPPSESSVNAQFDETRLGRHRPRRVVTKCHRGRNAGPRAAASDGESRRVRPRRRSRCARTRATRPVGIRRRDDRRGRRAAARGDHAADRRVHAAPRRRLRRGRFAQISRRHSATASRSCAGSATGRPWHLAIDTGMSRAGVQWNDDGIASRARWRITRRRARSRISIPPSRMTQRAIEQERRFADALARDCRCDRRCCTPRTAPRSNIAGRRAGPWRDPGVFLYGVGSGNSPEIEPEPVVVGARARRRSAHHRRRRDGELRRDLPRRRASAESRRSPLAMPTAIGARSATRATVLVGGTARAGGRRRHDGHDDDRRDRYRRARSATSRRSSAPTATIESTSNEVAAIGDLSPYEVLTGLRGRLPRRYVEA